MQYLLHDLLKLSLAERLAIIEKIIDYNNSEIKASTASY